MEGRSVGLDLLLCVFSPDLNRKKKNKIKHTNVSIRKTCLFKKKVNYKAQGPLGQVSCLVARIHDASLPLERGPAYTPRGMRESACKKLMCTRDPSGSWKEVTKGHGCFPIMAAVVLPGPQRGGRQQEGSTAVKDQQSARLAPAARAYPWLVSCLLPPSKLEA